jgi:TPP-dependent pyruvate/acetoin dehydrogenase alpha subunit
MGLSTNEKLALLDEEIQHKIEQAVAYAEASPSPDPADALEHVFYEGGQA